MAKSGPLRASPSLVSVIIPARNAAGTLPEQLAALANQSYTGKWEIIVADNGSNDATRWVAEAWVDRVPALRVVDAAGSAGPGAARNAGAAAARGDLLAFCDADDVVAPGWLAALAEAARRYDIVAGALDDTGLNPPAVRAWRPARARALPRAGGFLPFAPSGNCAVWAEVFRATGGFDPAWRQSEDVEWSWRAQLAGYRLGFAPEAVVQYRYRRSAAAVLRQGFRVGYAAVRLQRRFAPVGLRRPPRSRAVRRWAWVAAQAPLLLSPARRGLWLRRFGEACGHATATLRFRALRPRPSTDL